MFWKCMAAAYALCIGFAYAQSYTVQKPGEPPVFVRQNAGGGYTVSKPGQTPTFVSPTPGGGYTVSRPGETPTFVRPSAGGGLNLQKPGESPTYVRPGPGVGNDQKQAPPPVYLFQNNDRGSGKTDNGK